MYSITYKQRKSIKLAPDAIVHINGQPTIPICPICNSQINISKYITNIATSSSTNGTVGTASFSMAMPRHGHYGKYMVRGGVVFGLALMDEVEIYIKGRFNDQTNKQPYYKCFWGIITSVEESYSEGVQEIHVSCQSMLKWLELMKTNEHPALNVFQSNSERIDTGSSLWTGKTYANMNPYQIIYSLMDITFLNMVVPSALDVGKERIYNKEGNLAEYQLDVYNTREKTLLDAWKEKFKKMKSNLRMFGTTSDSFIQQEEKMKKEATNANNNNSSMAAVRTSETRMQINYNSSALMGFRPFFRGDEAKAIDPIHNTYKNNLEIANEIKLLTGFEFYLDTNGEFIFKPPFWNLDIRKNPVYVIEDSEILNWNFVENEAEVRTRYEVTGSILAEFQTDGAVGPRGIYTNYALAKQFGMRTEQVTMQYLRRPHLCYFHAISELDRTNAKRFQGSITIIGRPELRLGIPVYIKSRDCFAYIENIAHNFTFGGPFTTVIQLEAIRRKYRGGDSNAISVYSNAKDSSYNPDLTIEGKSRMLLYEKDEELLRNQLVKDSFRDSLKASLKPKEGIPAKTTLEDKVTTQSKDSSDMSKEVNEEPFTISNRAGLYKEYELSDPKVQEILANLDTMKNKNNPDGYLEFLKVAIPISDEEGYELIGVFENGRCLELTPTNEIIPRAGSFSELLNNALSKNGKNSYFSVQQVMEVDVNESPSVDSSTSNTIDNKEQSKNDIISSKYNASFSYFDKDPFLKLSSYNLANLAPETDTDTSACSCHYPFLENDNPTQGTASKKTMSSYSKNRR